MTFGLYFFEGMFEGNVDALLSISKIPALSSVPHILGIPSVPLLLNWNNEGY